MTFKHAVGFGVAGNFAGHLEQAGEATDFLNVKVENAIQPKALFPFYIPSQQAGFLSQYPLSSDSIIPPNDADNLQIEPEVAIVFDITYQDNKVVALTPVKFAAYNDCSIRKPNAKKISEKKNWGENTKGISQDFIGLTSFTKGCELDKYRIASFHIRNGEINRYGEDSAAIDYSYFHEQLNDWMIDRMNNQKDEGPAEDLALYLSEANYPEQAIISIGATRYTEFGETNFLQSGDESIVVVYDGEQYGAQDIEEMVSTKTWTKNGVSLLSQVVR
ncbi:MULTISPECIES: DUF5718 family protein [Aliivibrio]|uniref:Uncharacterized protein n=1 Tax=Aliivibrio finisterrensis TaxID=511998 RepID=A0A4Q5KVX1_9GAMM|nr:MULTISPECIES: DUF5718 family protein [Aliivibrio]MDD9179156.1 DUF5718 family protein [Aliivibrio sp. A6]RYU52859.1 hypothetical protein ERW57_05425 [Aliivibrio finisterrensis]RYU54584.1 hypothetical protein ERW56_05325 [Aliivibrio finisterrensis]RYU57829.1 hypothetical protein ERW50_10230 [Aliivibrio finisterrensis]RYU65257.1 hypothetical protein ERW53_06580 [Aliivibrio finisterrensis]